jgi:hypothetical protein
LIFQEYCIYCYCINIYNFDVGGKRKAENSFSKKPKSIKLDEIKSTNSDDDDEDEDESDETLDFEDDSDNGLTGSYLIKSSE